MEEKVKLGRYRHYKGEYYTVIAVAANATNGEPGEDLVIYECLETKLVYARKISEFSEPVELFVGGVVVGTSQVPRFQYIGPLQLTREEVSTALAETSGRVTMAARKLGVSRDKMRHAMKRLELGD